MSTKWTIDKFMNNHFNKLPFDLKIKIIKRATQPVPKFKYGDPVEFCESHKQQILANNHNILHTEMPINCLLVVSDVINNNIRFILLPFSNLFQGTQDF